MKANKADIEDRYAGCGFAYTANTRMLFAPLHTATRKVEDRDKTDIVLSAASRWPEPTERDIELCRAALVERYPDRKLLCETTEGLVPIYEPVAVL